MPPLVAGAGTKREPQEPQEPMTCDDKPLEGRRVVVTRAADQAGELAARLATLGAEVLLLPLVEFAPPADTAPLDRALAELDGYDWLFLTSQNVVRYLARRAQSSAVDLASALGPGKERPRIAAVGKMTAQAAQAEGWRVDRVASGRNGEAMVAELAGQLAGARVLLPRSDLAPAELPRALAAVGALPVDVVAYRTLTPATLDPGILDRIEQGGIDVVTFASPSAFRALAERLSQAAFRQMTATARLAAIGPTTAAAIREAGCAVAIEAQVPTAAGLVAAIAAYYAQNPVTQGGSQ
jgi:uroporphyrinogen-III synthase